MKKLTFPALLLLCVAFIACSCSKDDEPKPSINPDSLVGRLQGTYRAEGIFFDNKIYDAQAVITYTGVTDSAINVTIEFEVDSIPFFLEIKEAIPVWAEPELDLELILNSDHMGKVIYGMEQWENIKIWIRGGFEDLNFPENSDFQSISATVYLPETVSTQKKTFVLQNFIHHL